MRGKPRVLFAASEAVPFMKTGRKQIISVMIISLFHYIRIFFSFIPACTDNDKFMFYFGKYIDKIRIL